MKQNNKRRSEPGRNIKLTTLERQQGPDEKRLL